MIRFAWTATPLAACLLFIAASIESEPVLAQNRPGYDGGQKSRKNPEMVFRRLDADGDGYVSRNEWLKPMALFDRLDSDGDGKLTYEELQANLVGSPNQARQHVKARDRPTGNDRRPAGLDWIDVHVHLNVGRLQSSNASSALDAAVQAMDANHIAKMVLMPQPMISTVRRGRRLPPTPIERWIKEARRYPDRFEVMGGGGSLNAMIHEDSPGGQASEALKRRFAARAEAILKLGAIGFGELALTHLSMIPGQEYMAVPADHPLMLMLSDIAAEHDVVIDVHFDPIAADIPLPRYVSGENPPALKRNLDAFERFLDHNRRAKISWAHVGSDRLSFWTASFTRDMLGRHPNLYMSLRMFASRSGLNHPLTNDGITADWMETFRQFPDRFFIGGDQFFLSSGLRRKDGPSAKFARMSQDTRDRVNRFLSYLPPEIARKFAFENAVRVYKIANTGRLAQQRQ